LSSLLTSWLLRGFLFRRGRDMGPLSVSDSRLFGRGRTRFVGGAHGPPCGRCCRACSEFGLRWWIVRDSVELFGSRTIEVRGRQGCLVMGFGRSFVTHLAVAVVSELSCTIARAWMFRAVVSVLLCTARGMLAITLVFGALAEVSKMAMAAGGLTS